MKRIRIGASCVVLLALSCVSQQGLAQYVGCYVDRSERALPHQLMASNATPNSCIEAAAAKGYAYAGLQYYGYCFGGNELGYDKKDDNKCDTPCTADPSKQCGGVWYNSIHATGLTPPLKYQGCFLDSPSRALPEVLMTSGATAQGCIDAAAAKGYPFAGLQYYGWCFAGRAPGYCALPDECNTPCNANKEETCGGAWRNSVYRTTVARTDERFTIINPHRNYPRFFAGSVHNHTVGGPDFWRGDGKKEEVVKAFSKLGYDFAAFTDHDKANTGGKIASLVEWNEGQCPKNMVCYWGTEAGKGRHHLFFGGSQDSIKKILGTTDKGLKKWGCEGHEGEGQTYRSPNDPCLAANKDHFGHNILVIPHPVIPYPDDQDDDPIPISSHPVFEHLYPSPSLGTSMYFDGLELNTVRVKDGEPAVKLEDSHDYWGWALRARLERDGRLRAKPFWGFLGDDPQPENVDQIVAEQWTPTKWLLVNSRTSSPQRDDIYDNIKSGNFFAVLRTENETGTQNLQKPELRVTVSPDNKIQVYSPQPSTIRFFDVCGQSRVKSFEDDRSATYIPDGSEGFIRVVVEQTLDRNKIQIYSQPLTILSTKQVEDSNRKCEGIKKEIKPLSARMTVLNKQGIGIPRPQAGGMTPTTKPIIIYTQEYLRIQRQVDSLKSAAEQLRDCTL